ncbi:MAG TPA: hypothetical protein DEP05_05570 [Betaproteobacteria bacterium]|nr:hypothetical protein [Betaproteobacteria bacterium]
MSFVPESIELESTGLSVPPAVFPPSLFMKSGFRPPAAAFKPNSKASTPTLHADKRTDRRNLDFIAQRPPRRAGAPALYCLGFAA